MANCLTLKKSNCVNCYKCIRHCPVKAIRFSGGQAHIIQNECILCGKCFVVCPQNAKEISSEVEKVKVLIQSGDPVVVSLAPSFVANWDGVGIESMKDALKKLGFFDAEETAIGATFVKREYERMISEDKQDIIISSCCTSVNLLIQKYYPNALPFLADVITPMQAHCKDIKKRIPRAKTVFVGPCVAKKDEAQRYEGIVDAVLTFEELEEWFAEAKIVPEQNIVKNEESRARFFPTAGGILKTMSQETGYNYIAVDGPSNCISTLRDIEAGKIHHCFVEMSMCIGSCIGGPVMSKKRFSPVENYLAVANFAGKNDFAVEQPDELELKQHFDYIDMGIAMPTETQISAVLREMGKYKPSQEYNCGSCGYETCREKAIAVCQGKAEVSMCIPYIKDKAESLSNTIFKNTPNGIVVVNENYEVQQINPSALKIMNLRYASDILGDQLVRILDPKEFIQVNQSGTSIYNEKKYLAEYRKYVEMTIVPDRENHILLCIMRDITDQESARERKENLSRETVEVADRVVEKQMRIVQEIASLLGETAAETKIALTKLKESVSHE
ncbi:MAG: [Fe-Fe] hydrogenase large subunit C-terminal domain-containing protein [Clostridia bacterium]|nr:[Fe-Fe] hydrogenase large subunit C-terminal domain-containing protein [Clostridia bacterium]